MMAFGNFHRRRNPLWRCRVAVIDAGLYQMNKFSHTSAGIKQAAHGGRQAKTLLSTAAVLH
jgi:hypothetical protein